MPKAKYKIDPKISSKSMATIDVRPYPNYVGYVDKYILMSQGKVEEAGNFAPEIPQCEKLDSIWISSRFKDGLERLSQEGKTELLVEIKKVFEAFTYKNLEISGYIHVKEEKSEFLIIYSGNDSITLQYTLDRNIYLMDLLPLGSEEEIRQYCREQYEASRIRKEELSHKVKCRSSFQFNLLSVPFIFNIKAIRTNVLKRRKYRWMDKIGMDINPEDWFLSLAGVWQEIINVSQRRKYGFSHEETWFLDDSLLGFLYSRLELYLEVSPVDLDYHRVEYNGKLHTQRQLIDFIIEKIRQYFKEENITDRIMIFEDVIELWGVVHSFMWW